MYAVVLTGGKQYQVSIGDTLRVERLPGSVGDEIELDRILLVNRDGEVTIGNPYIEGVKVKARILQQGRKRKILVFKYKRRKNYRRKRGHRQYFTELKIEDILLN